VLLSIGLETSGYIFVYQDVRGRYMSEGTFIEMTPHKDVKGGPADVDESTDTYDTIDWLVKHIEHNNGRVGLRGISYPGFFATAGAIGAHPALKAASPQAPQGDWFMGDDWHHLGAFCLMDAFNWMYGNGRAHGAPTTTAQTRFDFGTPDGYKFFLGMGPLADADTKYFHGKVPDWTELMEHGTYDEFWRSRNILPHLRDIHPAVMTVGGWYDANNLYGALHVHEAISRQSPKTRNILIMGPWSHGQWASSRGENGATLGSLRFGSETSVFFQEQIELPFFEYYLKGKADPKLPKAYVFETGANRWRKFESWPPKDVEVRSLYLREGASLSFSLPKKAAVAFDEYPSDPANPVPFIEGLATDLNPQSADYMARDQRFGSTRPDVLVYRSDVLTEDLTIAGPITPKLFVSTTGTDSDFIVKLIDVYPNDTADESTAAGQSGADQGDQSARKGGLQELVRGDVIRGKFRNSFEKPEPFVPGKVAKVEFVMPDVLHTFLKGHRIMVQIQSTWFPLIDANPQTFVDIYHASTADFKKSVQRVYRSPDHPSKIIVNLLPNLEHR